MAKSSYENALELYNESKILYKGKHYPRAYFLAIVCTEELTKAMICKNVWAGTESPENLVSKEKGRPRNVLKDHKAKQLLFGLLPLI
jgi:AbiV family abortive infection protein